MVYNAAGATPGGLVPLLTCRPALQVTLLARFPSLEPQSLSLKAQPCAQGAAWIWYTELTNIWVRTRSMGPVRVRPDM